MNKILKPIFIFLLVAILLASFCISAFAATASYKVIAGAYSQELADLTCNYKSIKKDNFAIFVVWFNCFLVCTHSVNCIKR